MMYILKARCPESDMENSCKYSVILESLIFKEGFNEKTNYRIIVTLLKTVKEQCPEIFKPNIFSSIEAVVTT